MQIVHTDNGLVTADCDSGKRQTRPFLRESAPHQNTCNSELLGFWTFSIVRWKSKKNKKKKKQQICVLFIIVRTI
jgi:hypothetical protein